MPVAIDHDGGEDATQCADLFEFFDTHRHRIRDFIAAQTEYFFAYQFGGELPLGLVGHVIFAVHRRAFG